MFKKYVSILMSGFTNFLCLSYSLTYLSLNEPLSYSFPEVEIVSQVTEHVGEFHILMNRECYKYECFAAKCCT